MALSFACSSRVSNISTLQSVVRNGGAQSLRVVTVKCETANEPPQPQPKLGVGSPIVIVEAPKMMKTATAMPCLRVNSGLIKPGDVGRIVSRKPKDLWAVRLSIGTYLLDGKYFRALELDD